MTSEDGTGELEGITITGTATASVELNVYIGGERRTVSVSKDATSTEVMAALMSAGAWAVDEPKGRNRRERRAARRNRK